MASGKSLRNVGGTSGAEQSQNSPGFSDSAPEVPPTFRRLRRISIHSLPIRLLTELLGDLDQRTADMLHIVIREIIVGSHRLYSKVLGQ